MECRRPITLITGFLESGKTSTIMDILKNGLVDLSGATLIIDIEEDGEVSYDQEFLKKHNIVLVDADNPAMITKEFLQELEDAYKPDRIFIEYNGIFKVSYFENLVLPKDWCIERQMTIVDGSCFELYMRNLKELFLDMICHTDMVLFNRCTSSMPLKAFDEIVKNVNKHATVVFENDNGQIIPLETN